MKNKHNTILEMTFESSSYTRFLPVNKSMESQNLITVHDGINFSESITVHFRLFCTPKQGRWAPMRTELCKKKQSRRNQRGNSNPLSRFWQITNNPRTPKFNQGAVYAHDIITCPSPQILKPSYGPEWNAYTLKTGCWWSKSWLISLWPFTYLRVLEY